MRIAELLPAIHPVPPVKYGGIERVVTDLSIGLADAGHEVTIYTCTGSTLSHPNIKLEFCSPYPTIEHKEEIGKWEMNQFTKLIAEQDRYDFIHIHIEPMIWRTVQGSEEINLLTQIKKPCLVTFHNQTYIDQNIQYYADHKELWDFNYSFVSDNQRKPLAFLPNTNVVHNGIPVESFEFNPNPEDYFVFLGRITKEKGIIEAITLARETGVNLVIAAKLEDDQQGFYDTEVAPYIDGEKIKFIGEVDHEAKKTLLKNAKAMFNPVQWEEPFGLVAVEALASGTPVIATPRGGMKEILVDDVTGFICENVEEMKQAVAKIDTIDRAACRTQAEKFDKKIMIQNYLDLFNRILAQ